MECCCWPRAGYERVADWGPAATFTLGMTFTDVEGKSFSTRLLLGVGSNVDAAKNALAYRHKIDKESIDFYMIAARKQTLAVDDQVRIYM